MTVYITGRWAHISIKLLHFQFDIDVFIRAIEGTRQFVREIMAEHRETYDPDNIRDLIDLYIQAEKNNFKDNGPMDGEAAPYSPI